MALRTPLSVTPHLYMGDSTGRPLDMGTVYFGEKDKDPEFYPIELFSDDALTLPLAQPVHTKGGYLYDKGDMVEPHAKEIIYSVKVLDSYGRKVFYKGAMMRNSWNDDVIEQINTALTETAEISAQIAKDIARDIADKAVLNSGFVVVDSFELGATITERNQALRHASGNTLYRWAGSLPKIVPASSTPFSTGGLGNNAWLEVSDAVLRSELASVGGVERIGNAVAKVQTVADMVSANWLRIGMTVVTDEYHNGTRKGGNTYVIEAMSSQVEDGGSYIFLANGLVAKGLFDGDLASLYQFGVKEGANINAEILAFYAFLRDNPISGDAVGKYNITAPLEVNATRTSINYKLELTTDNTSTIGFSCDHRDAYATGKLSVFCGNNATTLESYNARRQDDGVVFYNARASRMPDVAAWGCKRNGISILSGTGGYGNSNMSSAGSFKTYACGSHASNFIATPTSVTNNGASSSFTQSATLVFAASDIPSTLQAEDFILCDGQDLMVTAVDRAANTVTVFPHLNSTDTKPCTFFIGCGVYLRGNDSNVIGVDVIDSVNGGIGAKLSTFYGATVGRIHVGTGRIGVAIMSGSSPNSSSLGGSIGYMYTETLPIDIIQTTEGAKGWVVHSGLRTLVSKTISPIIPNFIDTQSKSTNDVIEHRNVRLNGVGGYIAGTYTTYKTDGITSGARYILLCEKKAGGASFVGDLFARGSTGSSVGNNQLQCSINITQAKASAYTASLVSSSDKAVSLCTLTYDGKSWFALDMTQFGTVAGFYFTGVQDSTSESIKSVTETGVTAVAPIAYAASQVQSVGDLKLALDGKSLQLKSPNNTDYKITVTDAGVLTATAI